MRATLALLLASGCNFLTSDLEDQAPVRPIAVPDDASRFGHAMAALPAGSCGAAGALVVAGQTVDGPQLYLVSVGEAGGTSRTRINNLQGRSWSASDEIVAMDPVDGTMSLLVELKETSEAHPSGKVRIVIDSDCDDREDTACSAFCHEGDLDAATEITGSEDQVDLFAGGAVTVTGNAASNSVTVEDRGAVLIPEDISEDQLGLAVARLPFDGPSGITEELAVGGNRSAILFFRTGLERDCDPREGAPTDVACE